MIIKIQPVTKGYYHETNTRAQHVPALPSYPALPRRICGGNQRSGRRHAILLRARLQLGPPVSQSLLLQH